MAPKRRENDQALLAEYLCSLDFERKSHHMERTLPTGTLQIVSLDLRSCPTKFMYDLTLSVVPAHLRSAFRAVRTESETSGRVEEGFDARLRGFVGCLPTIGPPAVERPATRRTHQTRIDATIKEMAAHGSRWLADWSNPGSIVQRVHDIEIGPWDHQATQSLAASLLEVLPSTDAQIRILADQTKFLLTFWHDRLAERAQYEQLSKRPLNLMSRLVLEDVPVDRWLIRSLEEAGVESDPVQWSERRDKLNAELDHRQQMMATSFESLGFREREP